MYHHNVNYMLHQIYCGRKTELEILSKAEATSLARRILGPARWEGGDEKDSTVFTYLVNCCLSLAPLFQEGFLDCLITILHVISCTFPPHIPHFTYSVTTERSLAGSERQGCGQGPEPGWSWEYAGREHEAEAQRPKRRLEGSGVDGEVSENWQDLEDRDKEPGFV